MYEIRDNRGIDGQRDEKGVKEARQKAGEKMTKQEREDFYRWARHKADVLRSDFESEAVQEIISDLDAADAEVRRLRAVIGGTHATYCTDAWTSRGLHAPECLKFEVDNG